MPETSYASCGDLSLAYQVFGDGPVELVFVAPFVWHVELVWAAPGIKAFFDQLATFCRVVLFDKAGFGLSDPVPHVRTLDDRAAEIEAVMDAVGFGKAVLFALGDGGPAAIVFAATRPERTRALVLTSTFSFTAGEWGWDDVDRDPAELRGVPGTWQLLAVDRHGPRAGSPEAELASMSTPGRRTAMRRSDRAVEVIARRTPWIVRGMARLAPATGRR